MICPKCNWTMRYDSVNQRWVCKHCGYVHQAEYEDNPDPGAMDDDIAVSEAATALHDFMDS